MQRQLAGEAHVQLRMQLARAVVLAERDLALGVHALCVMCDLALGVHALCMSFLAQSGCPHHALVMPSSYDV